MEEAQWLKITIQADQKLIEPLEDYLVGIMEAAVETGAEGEPGYGTLTAYLGREYHGQEEAASSVQGLCRYLEQLAAILQAAMPKVEWEMLAGQDWSSRWKEYFTPFSIIDGLVIAPTWSAYQAGAGERVIVMDPGMAFGTGHHDTTRLCLHFLREAIGDSGMISVLDVGTGTGILGMAALLFGAREVMAVDNDPEAVRVARANAADNGFGDRMVVTGAVLSELPGHYEVVVANIVHDVLLALADDFGRLTRPGGALILSGLMAGGQQDSIKRHYLGCGWEIIAEQSSGEWVAIRFRRWDV